MSQPSNALYVSVPWNFSKENTQGDRKVLSDQQQ